MGNLYRYRSRVYRYRYAPVQVKGVPVQVCSEQPVPVQVKGVPVQVVPIAPFFAYLCTVKSCILIPLFRDPKK